MSSMDSTQKTIVLKSSEGEMFELEEMAALESQVFQDMIEAGCANDCIPLPSISSKILAKIIEYCKRHSEATDRKDLKTFDAEFVEVDESTLFDLIMAANYLNIKSLLDLTCQTVADMIKEKSPEEIRKIYGIENDFTPEEEERIRKENAWAFEK